MGILKLNSAVEAIGAVFGTDAPYIIIVHDPETHDMNVSSNMSIDDMIAALVKTAEHVEENGPSIEADRA